MERTATMSDRPALLVLEDGRAFRGTSYGAEGETFGEAVFNTGLTGYQEALSEPTYHRQAVAQTAAQICDTGIHANQPEGRRHWGDGYRPAHPRRLPARPGGP